MSDEIRMMANKIRTCEDKLLRSKDPWKIDELIVELRKMRMKLSKMKYRESLV